MKRTILFVVVLILSAGLLDAQQVCPCVPVSHLWVVDACETWNCAASAAILANGDPNVLAMPAGTGDGRWVVVRRVAAGSYIPPADALFVAESFDGVDGAMTRFATVASDHAPILLSAPDGKFLVIMLKDPVQKKRAVK